MHRHVNVSVCALFASLVLHGAIGSADRMETPHVLSTHPSQVQLNNVQRVDYVSRGFSRLEDGTYGISLFIEYRDAFDRIHREFFNFRFAAGQVVREGDSLFLDHPKLAGEKTLVGFGKWWSSPRWQAGGRGTIEVKTEWQNSTVALST